MNGAEVEVIRDSGLMLPDEDMLELLELLEHREGYRANARLRDHFPILDIAHAHALLLKIRTEWIGARG